MTDLYIPKKADPETFVPPPGPAVRDLYIYKRDPVDNGEGKWKSNQVHVFKKGDDHSDRWGTHGDELVQVAEYTRTYPNMYNTFEPFRQQEGDGWHDYALISADYTHLSVLDLESGEIIAEETSPYTHEDGSPDWIAGFCPTGFYVPDWWDMHDDSIERGSQYWDKYCCWPLGDFGFEIGCIWGDDTSWKLKFVDLSRVSEGVVTTDERFGYVEVAGSASNLRDNITLYSDASRIRVNVELGFDLGTGKMSGYTRDYFNYDTADEED